MPQYVILRHECPADYGRPSHWDFMLESGPVLRTWALETLPREGECGIAEALSDHRLAYLDYEGPISRGRGSVTRWDAGTYRIVHETNDELVVELHGAQLQLQVTLVRQSDDPQRWSISCSSTASSS